MCTHCLCFWPVQLIRTASDEDHNAFKKLEINYRLYTGTLNYLACWKRPDLAAAVSILSRFNQRPGLQHWKEVLHFWRYLLGTQDRELLLKLDDKGLVDRIMFYTDATWVEDQET
ncbi:hypothetical protein VP01_3871g2 [Puccinia sorghi]|uniref:Retrovirus-related Pol polyprotein from transposon TNT 1-94 n=1 Tax=Puccinia sorghi TaxID=27349 RepID=A0A0L6UT21_9BASI|nr:hypothetical protein VP01_3871g2 [Puccinia sorghi]